MHKSIPTFFILGAAIVVPSYLLASDFTDASAKVSTQTLDASVSVVQVGTAGTSKASGFAAYGSGMVIVGTGYTFGHVGKSLDKAADKILERPPLSKNIGKPQTPSPAEATQHQ